MLRILFIAVCLVLGVPPATAQHNHERGHDAYQSWSSRKVANCCSNRDCGVLRADETRETNAGTQVKIDGQWCPVLREHYIVKGHSPDWNASHACIRPQYPNAPQTDPCERLLCFSGKGGV